MFRPKRLVVPVDFSERCVATAAQAAAITKRFDSELIFVHVVPRSEFEPTAFKEGAYTKAFLLTEAELTEIAVWNMKTFVRRVDAEAEVEPIILLGDPVVEIENLIKERPTDLVLIPTHGYGPFRRFILGSVTSKLLHDLECPVFTGTHIPELMPIDPHPYRRIACAVDLGDESEKVLRWGMNLARSFDAEIEVIHAAPFIDFGLTYSDWMPVDARDALIRQAREHLDALMAKVGCKAVSHVDSSDTIEYVRDMAKELRADVLVIGRSPRDGVLGRLRTHSYGIIRESPCPVISV